MAAMCILIGSCPNPVSDIVGKKRQPDSPNKNLASKFTVSVTTHGVAFVLLLLLTFVFFPAIDQVTVSPYWRDLWTWGFLTLTHLCPTVCRLLVAWNPVEQSWLHLHDEDFKKHTCVAVKCLLWFRVSGPFLLCLSSANYCSCETGYRVSSEVSLWSSFNFLLRHFLFLFTGGREKRYTIVFCFLCWFGIYSV